MSDTPAFLDMTAEIVSAFVSNNAVRASELAELISSVHSTLSEIAAPKPAPEPAPELKPAVPVKKSVTDDYIISLEDGRKFKTMRRYLAGLGMTPDEYRAKWGLPSDYPMVAPGYAARRSELAKLSGLGSRRSQGGEAQEEPAEESDEVPAEAEAEAPESSGAKKAAPAKRRSTKKAAA